MSTFDTLPNGRVSALNSRYYKLFLSDYVFEKLFMSRHVSEKQNTRHEIS